MDRTDRLLAIVLELQDKGMLRDHLYRTAGWDK
jgi:hypothetical protein